MTELLENTLFEPILGILLYENAYKLIQNLESILKGFLEQRRKEKRREDERILRRNKIRKREKKEGKEARRRRRKRKPGPHLSVVLPK